MRPEREPCLAHQPVGHVQLERRHQSRRRAHHQPQAGEGDEHEHGKRTGTIGCHAVAQFIRVRHMQLTASLDGCRLQPSLRRPEQGGIVHLADFAPRKDHRGRARIFNQQALAHGPDENKQPHDREQKRAQQTQYRALSMRRPSFRCAPQKCMNAAHFRGNFEAQQPQTSLRVLGIHAAGFYDS